ncbi:hypothetical protein H0H81_006550 [Sphagnurus paluster]|uniref:Uncharacterized protein n=1 Tax=Sphagnurus paluster TaxID=117069 RepID=A0A9P7GTE0_9AGAR|nr:hypothetical protein H0H81_006550 [Sphagnurus paluster]
MPLRVKTGSQPNSSFSEELVLSGVPIKKAPEDRHAMKMMQMSPSQLPLPVTHAPPPRQSKTRNPIHVITSRWKWFTGKHQVVLPSRDRPSQSGLPQPVQDTVLREREVELEEVVVDEVVVDRSWSDDVPMDPDSESDDGSISNYSMCNTNVIPGLVLRPAAPADDKPRWTLCWHFLWIHTMAFFSSKFSDAQIEADFQKEVWQESKPLALWASAFFIANWTLGTTFIQGPIVLADKIFYYCVSRSGQLWNDFLTQVLVPQLAPLLTFPIIIFCAFDLPERHATFYQIFLCVAIWIWPFYQVLFMLLCGFYDRSEGLFTCGTKDFLTTF